ncbi:MAG: FtsX-like permease family protein [Rhodanobacteraceae bacterium]|nr:MAG: FtsX-like permease family protein [Rhodanobacteraceae bacterium]
MFGYYLDLALRSFRRHRVLTALMVLALGLGIGASITTLTVLKLLSGDPLPQKSARIFAPEIDPLPAASTTRAEKLFERWGNLMTYTDAMNLLRAHKAERQAVMALASGKITTDTPGQHPFFSDGVVTTSDFFAMFGAEFQYGSGWTAQDDQDRAHVAVIAGFLNDKLFGGANSVGKMLRIGDRDYRIVGVLKPWAPQPRFYSVNLGGRGYGNGDALFLPLQAAIADGVNTQTVNCFDADVDINHLETAPCAWVSTWVELANASGANAYKTFLSNYVAQQISLGRLHHPEVALPSLMGFLSQQRVVPDDARMQTSLAFGFLLICVVNTVGLLLAKCLRRSREIGVRRALGATRSAIFTQFMVESGMVGMAGGVLGLAFAELGLWAIRHQPAEYAGLAHLDVSMFIATFVIALIASLVAGLLPAWRACAVAPAPQLKSV